MKRITHKLAQRYINLAADGLLKDDQRTLLNDHLTECASCNAEYHALNALETRLKNSFHARLDVQGVPAEKPIANIRLQNDRTKFSDRLKVGFNFIAGIVLLLVLVIFFNALFIKLKGSPKNIVIAPAITTETPTQTSPTNLDNLGLIAFASDKNGNSEIYTMQADGSHVTNITNNPGGDYSPAWSRDGKRIAFVSERNGNADIFMMNFDGSGMRQLTDNNGYDGYFTWSPNGQLITYLSTTSQDPNNGQLFVMNADGSAKIILTNEPGSYIFLGWSPDSQRIVYLRQNLGSDQKAGLYAVNVDGSGTQFLMKTDSVSSLKWEDAQHFIAVIDFTPWQIYRFSTGGSPPVLIASYQTPVSTWFGSGSNLNYVVKHFDTWDWYHIDGTTTLHMSTWPSFSAKCQQYSRDLYLDDANNWVSPNGESGVVTVYCNEGRTWFYYVNADGSSIKLLMNDPIPLWDMGEASWSPDGRFILVDLGDFQTGKSDLYLINVDKNLKDPSLSPTRLTTDNALIQGMVWQPIP